ncbi:MAG: hybrid sensor histidine kinase/response regulator [Panacagrimonas sp.]
MASAAFRGPPQLHTLENLVKTRVLGNAILNSATFSIIATDADGIIQLFNLGAERMLGYTADEVVNRLCPSDMHDPAEVLARADILSQEFSTQISPGFGALAFKASRGIEDSYELTCICKNGGRFPAIMSITALRDDAEDIIGYLLIGTDNSARKQVEAELIQAKAAAERANVAKSDFLSSMSHELRSPLNAILGFAQLMDSDKMQLTRDQKNSTGHILKAGWYLLDLINEILDLALIESGKMVLSTEPTDLYPLVLDCKSMLEPQAKDHRVALDIRHVDQPCHIQADRTRVQQVLLNLLSNAIKYNRSGGSVSVVCDLSSPTCIRISVSDTGPGLSPEQLAQLFQPFNRLGQESGREEGTGIGLMMTKRLVELMGGVIGVESTVGKGSVFWVDWLRPVEAPLASTFDGIDAQLPTLAAIDDAKYTLLYVEDNPANLNLVEQLIAQRPGLRLLSAQEARRGIEIARESRPDVILMDINLPGISGIKALRLLREDPVTQHIPVIAVSANAMPHDIRQGLEAGFFRYLTKPIRIDDFMSVLDDALEYAESESGHVGARGPR